VSKKTKIPIDAAQTGLNQPFASLDGSKVPQPVLSPKEGVDIDAESLKKDIPKKLGRVVLRRETASRGGKAVIVIYDFPLTFHNKAIEELARTLRKECGTGGTVRDRTIEIQGDQPAKIRAILEAKGFRVAGIS
jgi:translation initiation factor 1